MHIKSIKALLVSATLVLSTSLIAISVNADPVNINKASAVEISKALKGIGKKKAQAIVDYRKKNGSFKNANEIMKVKGIGQSVIKSNGRDILVK